MLALAQRRRRCESESDILGGLGEGGASFPTKGQYATNQASFNLTGMEKQFGWAHKASLINHLERFGGFQNAMEAEYYVDRLNLVETRSETACSICLDDRVPAGEGVVLAKCLHLFCKECLRRHIRAADTAAVTCPFSEDNFQCNEQLKPREILALVGEQEYRRHFENLSLREAAANMSNVFHCLTPDCFGFCIIDQPGVAVFRCDICRARNCIRCRVIHVGSCREYKRQTNDDQNRIQQRRNDELSEIAIRRNLQKRIFMRCPRCNTVIEKNGGCAQMICRASGCGYRFRWNGVEAPKNQGICRIL